MKLYALVKKNWHLLAFLCILAVGLYLRFWHIEEINAFGWDQQRDAFHVKSLLEGNLQLKGPRTGIGDFYLGPLYYYLLAPFYFLTGLDPSASNYFNILANIFNFTSVYFVISRLFSKNWGLFAMFVYAASGNLIIANRTAWNVSLLPGISIIIFYLIWQIVLGRYKLLPLLATLTGVLFHIHFTAVFVPSIILLSLLFMKEKRKSIPWLILSIPFFLIWFIPTIYDSLTSYNDNFYRFRNFLRDYYIGLHFRFMLHRLPDSLIQFQSVLFFAFLSFARYLLPIIFAILVFQEKDKNLKLAGFLTPAWFLVPLFGFTIYGGPISDYYFLLSLPAVFFIIIYIQKKLLNANMRLFLPILIVFWLIYAIYNTRASLTEPQTNGLKLQKETASRAVNAMEKNPFLEGTIENYLFEIYKEKQK